MNKTLMAIVGVAIIAGAAVAGVMMMKKGEPDAKAQETAQAATSIEPAADEKAAPATEEATAPAEAEKTPSADDPVVAKVDGKNILRSEVLAFMKNMPPQMQQLPVETIFPVVLDQVINGKIVEEKAIKTDVANSPEVAKRMGEAKEQIIRVVYMEDEINKNLSEARVKKAYDKFVAEQGKEEEVKARHILVDKEETAKEIIKKLDGGAKFEDLAKEMSKDTANKATGGDLGYFTQKDMVKEFGDAAFAMKKGEVSKTPVKTQFGYHIIQVEDRRTRPVPSFETVKSALETQERRALLTELLESWRKKADVETFDMNGNPIKDKPATPEETKTE